ncbi:hypothetical protein O3M35_002653 [Rhynocoris fuscipes]|uniref:Uncharacterized protein n=1 Tax=Rhynocoris fuscipes TaxID=488301 RepID=A0AAW1CMI8_9HEMI
MAERRRFTTRPRTRVYDCNYNIGENYYRSALDNLDRKYGRLPTETLEAPKRPVSIGDLDSFLGPQREQTAATAALAAAVAENEEDQIRQTMQRIAKARAAFAPTPEENFERSFMHRREEVKKRFNEKMLDTVGLNGILKEDEPSTTLRRRAVKILTDTEEDTPKLTKWTALREPATFSETADELAARARARASRARLADLESEMEELAERGAARERRLAGLRQLLNESEEADTVRLRQKVTTTTVEKRVL